jgi:thiol-disulfide isomerase/thioredoxin
VKQAKVLLGALLALLLVAGLYLVNRYWIAPATQRTGKLSGDRPMAPQFSLIDLNGRKLELADHKGKVVLLDFWATWCGPCRIEIPGLVRLQERYRDQGLVIIGISLDDSLEPVREFYREYRMNYPVAMGDERISALYGGILGLPTTFLIGRDGRIYAKHMGATDISVFEEEVKELLGTGGAQDTVGFRQSAGARPAGRSELDDPAEAASAIPGLDLSRLTPAQVAQFKRQLAAIPCDCGCKRNVLACRLNDPSCRVSRRMAREQLEKFVRTRA